MQSACKPAASGTSPSFVSPPCSLGILHYTLDRAVADHAKGTTSENMYAGLEAVHFVNPCQEPYNLQRVPQYVVHFLDAVLDKNCQMVYDKSGAHFDNLWGDINLVNGVCVATVLHCLSCTCVAPWHSFIHNGVSSILPVAAHL